MNEKPPLNRGIVLQDLERLRSSKYLYNTFDFMKHFYHIFYFLLFPLLTTAQVGIGTVTLDDGSALEIESTTGALVPPRMSTANMNLIPTPLNGAIVFNTTQQSLFIHKNGVWQSLSNGSLVVNRSYSGSNGAISTTNNTYFDFPIGNSDVIATDTSLYNVTANGTATVLVSGTYQMSASFSTPNMPSGNKKYIIGVTRNGTLIGYLSRGFSSLPGTDYWGTSGTLMYPLAANDVIKFQYVLNNGGTNINAKFFNFGISKLQ